MSALITTVDAWVRTHPTLVLYALFGAIALLFGSKSRVDAWCNSHPRVAGAFKLLRAIGIDPWHILAAVQLIIRGRLPESSAQRVQRVVDAVTRIGLLVLLAASVSGCAGSFEEIRVLRPSLETAGQMRIRLLDERCVSLDNQHRYWGAVGKGTALLAGAEGVATWPAHSADAQIGLAVGAGVSAAVAATALYISEDAGDAWVRECSQ